MVPRRLRCAAADRLFRQRPDIKRALDGQGICLHENSADTTPAGNGESKLRSRQRY